MLLIDIHCSDESSQKGQVRWVPSSLLTPLVKLSLILLQTMVYTVLRVIYFDIDAYVI